MKQKIGWFCTYTPIEIIEAAGIQPYGIKEDSGKGFEDVYLGDAMCSYVRSCFGGALVGSYNFLDAVVIAHSCECMRRLYDGWTFKRDEIKPECIYFLDVPKIRTEKSIRFFTANLEEFKAAIERKYGEISDDSLIESVGKYNLTRDLIGKINETRKSETPSITGREAMELATRFLTTPPDDFNAELEKYLSGPGADSDLSNRPRVVVYGGPCNKALIECIEEAGAVAVQENVCNGLRMFGDRVNSDEEPIKALARHYLGKPPCPRMLGETNREGLEDVKRAIEEFNADGVIYYSIKFCANLQAGWPLFKEHVGEELPVKFVEGELSGEFNKREVRTFVRKLAKKRRAA